MSTTKEIEGGRGRGGCFFVMAMAMAKMMVTAMAMTISMINHCLLHDSNETIAAII